MSDNPVLTDNPQWPHVANFTQCLYEKMEYLTTKFWLIVVFGGGACTLGILSNCLLLRILLITCKNDSFTIYLTTLTVVDLGILITYIMVMCFNILYDYVESLQLYHLWLLYVPYLFTLSKILTLSATYLVLVCSLERYFSVLRIAKNYTVVQLTQNKRRAMIICIILFCASFRLCSFWELEVVQFANCTGFARYHLLQSSMVRNVQYANLYNVVALQAVQTFVPFISLIMTNFLIILQWNDIVKKGSDSVSRKASLQQRFGSGAKGLCTARRTMIALISSYLACNVMNVLITLWEYGDKKLPENHPEFYTFVSDLVTLMTVLNSCARLPLYCVCNWKVRKQVIKFFDLSSAVDDYHRCNNDWRYSVKDRCVSTTELTPLRSTELKLYYRSSADSTTEVTTFLGQ